jgi:hypothetical protein
MAEPPNLMDSIEAQLREERAVNLGRAGKQMEKALRELETGVPGISEDELLDAAGEKVWYYLIARESCGMYDNKGALAIYGVPDRVLARVGVIRRR